MAKNHKVRLGECAMSLAYTNGFFWETVWNHPNNARLRELRNDPNVLMPGDMLYIPDKQVKYEAGETEQHHVFRQKGTPALLRLRIIHEAHDQESVEEATDDSGVYAEPRPEADTWESYENTPYSLYVDGAQVSGTTDDDGRLEVPISPAARHGKLILNPGTDHQSEILIHFGYVHPVEELVGVCQRLSNLGFDCPMNVETITPEVEEAIRAFQRTHSLEETGQVDHTTRERIKEVHGG